MGTWTKDSRAHSPTTLSKVPPNYVSLTIPPYDPSLASTATDSSYKHLKLVKRGFSGKAEPLTCGIMFESNPAWVWALRLSDWEAIAITDTDELRLRQYHLSTWSLVSDRLRIVLSASDTKLAHSVHVWFVSGSRGFLDSFQGPIGTPSVFWIEQCGRRRPGDTPERTWFTVSHESVGGSTTSRGVFGRSSLNDLNMEVDPLRRTLSHIMKFSIRPSPCTVPCLDHHYLLGHRLVVSRLTQPVVFETSFSRTGWGKRSLTEEELAQAFDLPPHIPWETGFAASLVPIQIFRAIVEAVLVSLRPQVQKRAGARARLEVGTAPPLPIDAVWLPDLAVWLPGSWSKTLIASKAVKSDDATVEQYPWNQRILLVLPTGNLNAIRGFERFALHVWYRSLFGSFIDYLGREYGPKWRHAVAQFARQLKQRGESPAPPLGKRKRLGGEIDIGPHNMGVEERWKKGRQTDGTGSHLLFDSRAESRKLDLLQDVKCGFRILRQVSISSWWEWTGGSSLFFWRWNGKEQMRTARDGIPIFVSSALPKQRRQKAPRLDHLQKVLVAGKIDGMVRRDYLETGYVANTVHFFAVPKGDSDIRVVFDGTSSGLNETLWAPNFFLPSAKSASMCLSFSTWMSDMDFGEMFHNFHMDPRIRPFSGVELGTMAALVPSLATSTKASSARPVLLRWTRLFMGMRPSPYLAIRHYYWGEEFARGNPGKIGNPMGYDRIRLNLPGMTEYDPAYPKVMKWRDGSKGLEDGHVAGDVVTFVDDVRVTGYSKSNCWEAYHQFASRVQYLGMQNAPRKFRAPSQLDAGAWTGTIFKIGVDHITKSVSQEKWDKGREMIERRLNEIKLTNDSRPFLDRRLLEKETGFLNHLSMTFETMVPFLKGFYLTLNSWREGRDENDWKVSPKRWKVILFAKAANGGLSDSEVDMALDRHDEVGAPRLVRASPSLRGDVEALWYMMGTTAVPEVSVRSRTVLTIVYGFGDASGSGLGATFTCGSGFNFRIGIWGAKEDPESSNWKEFTNIVESLEDEADSGNLKDSEVYMFTELDCGVLLFSRVFVVPKTSGFGDPPARTDDEEWREDTHLSRRRYQDDSPGD